MLTSTMSILLAVFAGFGFLVTIALLIKIIKVNSEEFTEINRMQGGIMNLWKGMLQNSPSEFGDYRIVRGLKWDAENKRYKSQSALSSEGLRAAFPN